MKKRMGSLLLALVMCLSLLPASALAATGTEPLTSTVSKQAVMSAEAVMSATNSPLGFDTEVGFYGTFNELYFGTFYADMTSENPAGRPHRWRILNTKTSVETDGLFLLSMDGYGGVRFALPREVESENWWTQPHNKWDSPLCAARLWCGELAESDKVFNAAEKSALLAVSKADERYKPTSYGYFYRDYGKVLNGKLDGEKVFYLSAEEFEDPRYGLTENGGDIGTYPLRSTADGAYYISEDEMIYDGSIASGSNVVKTLPTYAKLFTGTSFSPELTATEKFFLDSATDFGFFPGFGSGSTENYEYSYNAYTAHPAMNLDGSKLLYIMAADNSGHQSYGTITDASTNWKWKVTLLGSDTTFKNGVKLKDAPANMLFGVGSSTVQVEHPALKDLDGYNTITAALLNAKGELVCYGSICTDQAAISTEVTLPAGLTDGTYTLRINAEQWNGEQVSDLAAKPYEVTIKVAASHSHPVCGDATCDDHGAAAAWTAITTAEELEAMTADSYCFLVGDVEAPETNVVGHLCTNGFALTGTLHVGTGGLTLCDCKGRTVVEAVDVAAGGTYDQYGLDVDSLRAGDGSTLNIRPGARRDNITYATPEGRVSICQEEGAAMLGEGTTLNIYGSTVGRTDSGDPKLPKDCKIHVYDGSTLKAADTTNEGSEVFLHSGVVSSITLGRSGSSFTIDEGTKSLNPNYVASLSMEQSSSVTVPRNAKIAKVTAMKMYTTLTVKDGGKLGTVDAAWFGSIIIVEAGGEIGDVTKANDGSTIRLGRCSAGIIVSEGTVKLSGAVSGATLRLAKPLVIESALGEKPEKPTTIDIMNADGTLKWDDGVFTTGWKDQMGVAAYGDYFAPVYGSGYIISKNTDGELCCVSAGHRVESHPICGATCTHDGAHQNVTDWTEVRTWGDFVGNPETTTGDITLTGGTYCLATSTKPTGTRSCLSIQGNVTICLGGNALNLNSGYIDVKNGATLTICDCVGTGKITNGTGYSTGSGRQGGAIYMESGAKVDLYGGTIRDSNAAWGGAVYVPQNATLTMYGGTLCGNLGGSSLSAGEAKGGAVYLAGGTFVMNGGTIFGNSTKTMNTQRKTDLNDGGGAVYIANGGVFTMNNGSIYGNAATRPSGNESADVSWDIGGCGVRVFHGTFNLNGGTLGTDETGKSQQDAVQVDASGVFNFAGGSMHGQACGWCRKTVTGTPTGQYEERYRDSTIWQTGGTVNMTGGTLVGDWGACVKVFGGTFTMSAGSMPAKEAVVLNGGTFNMSGGVIGNKTTSISGKGVLLNGGTFNMSGGEITGFEDHSVELASGAILHVSGTVKITGSGSTSYGRNNPKNVYLKNGAKVTVGNLSSGAQIGVSMEQKAGVFSNGGSGYAGCFTADNAGYSISASGSNLQLSGLSGAVSLKSVRVNGTALEKSQNSYYPITVKAGETVQLSAEMEPADAAYWWYTSSDSTSFTLDGETGALTAHEATDYYYTIWLCYDDGNQRQQCHLHLNDPDQYTVTYDTQGRGTAPAASQVVPGGTVSAPTVAGITGYVVGGWYKDKACTEAWDFENDTVTSFVTLYAKWIAKSYLMTLDANGGACDTASVFLTYGQPYGELPTPTRSGYTFDGWYDAGGNKLVETDALNREIPPTQAERTLTAHWTPGPATAPTVTKGSDLTLTYGYASADSISVTAEAEDGHTITGYQWYTCDAEGKNGAAIDGAIDSSLSIETGRSAGTYHYYCAVTATREDNQQTATANSGVITVTVNKAAWSATVSMDDYTYDDTVSAPGISANPGNGTVTYYYSTENTNSGGTEWKGMTATTLNAGTYYLYATIGATANYEAFTTPAVSFTVGKATPTVTWPTLDAIYVNDTLADGDLKNGSGDGTFSITGTKTWATSGSGITTVTFTPTDTVNYDTLTNSNIAVTVNQRTVEEITTTIPAAITDKDYGTAQGNLGLPTEVEIRASGNKTFRVPISWSGYDPHVLTPQTLTGTLILNAIADEVTQPTTAITATTTVTLKALTAGAVTFSDKTETYTGRAIAHTIEDLPTGVASAAYTYAGTGATEYGPSATAPTDAGTYTVTVTFTMQPGYAQKADASATLTINKAAGSVTAPTAVASLTYNGEAQTLIRAGSSTTGTVQYRLGSGDYGTTLPAATDADTYTVYYRVVGDRNHENVAESSVRVTIAQQSVTVPAADTTQFTYNGEAQTYTVEENALYTVSGNKQTAAGTHTVSVTLNDPANYVWSDGKNAAQTFDFVIAPATVTITVADKSAYRDSEAPDLSKAEADKDYTVSGLIGADTLTTLPTLRYDPEPDMSVESDTTAIRASGADAGDNYTIEYVDGKLTITRRPVPAASRPATVTVPVSSDADKVEVKATVSGGNATVEVSDEQIEKVAQDGSGAVTVDVSGLKNAESATLPAHVVEKADEARDTALTVALPSGSVSLDEKALASISEGEDVTVSVQRVPATDLNEAQQKAVGDMANIGIVVDVDLYVGSAKRSSFNGGKLTISVPYTPKKNEDVSKLTVWFIRDDGSIENMGGYYDAAKKCFVFETTHLSRYLLVNTAETQGFVDVPVEKYFYSAVNWAASNGITGGVDETHFAPYASCTRGQLVTFLWRAAGQPAAKNTNTFSDVAAGRYCEAAVAWAAENEIVGGYDDGTFRPDATVTRQQTAAILWRFAKYAGMDVTVGEDTNILSFSDALTISDYAFPAIQWAVGAEVMGGSGDKLLPRDTCTRAQIVTMLYRCIAK